MRSGRLAVSKFARLNASTESALAASLMKQILAELPVCLPNLDTAILSPRRASRESSVSAPATLIEFVSAP